MSRADRERWQARWTDREATPEPPEAWLVEHAGWLHPGSVLDVAAGAGRNALWLAAHGFAVTALDIAPAALDRLAAAARERQLRVTVRCADLDQEGALAGLGPFEGLVIVRYKPSPAQWAGITGLLAPAGRLLLCSFGKERAAFGFDPAYCLEESELRAILEPDLVCLRYERLGPAADHLEGSIWERPR